MHLDAWSKVMMAETSMNQKCEVNGKNKASKKAQKRWSSIRKDATTGFSMWLIFP